jgi:thiamine biosynthesis protein ThiS
VPEIILNGETTAFTAEAFPATLAVLVRHLGLAPSGVVAEVRGEVVRPGEFEATRLRPGDAVEIVQLVGGG